MVKVEPGDAIQIELLHRWQGCLAVVSEVKPWGVVAYVLIPLNDGTPPGAAFIRLAWEDFQTLGVKPPLQRKSVDEG